MASGVNENAAGAGVLADTSLGQVSVNIGDVERATAFYRDALGLPHLFSSGGMAFFMAGDTRLMLSNPEGEFSGKSSILYFKVSGIEGAHEALAAKGVVFRRAPFKVHASETSELWMAFFDDGEGNTHALMEDKPL